MRTTHLPSEACGGLDDTLCLFAKICHAVGHAHLHGVIHRDLKPSNIRISPDGEPHVLDFGAAKPILSTTDRSERQIHTMPGHFLGTLAYASPEQVQTDAERVDIRTDVYSLGVMLYEAVTGAAPYEVGGSVADVVRSITMQEPRRPSAIAGPSKRFTYRIRRRTQIDDELDTIILKTLAKDPERRYSSADGLGRDIERYLAGDPIDAKRDSHWYVLRKMLRRYKLQSGFAIASVLLLVVLAVTMFWMNRRVREEANVMNQIRLWLEDSFAAAEPAQPGEDVSLRTVVDEAVRMLDRAPDQPRRVQAALRTTFGTSYRSQGLLAQAKRELETALRLRQAQFHGDHPELAQSFGALGLLHRDQGDLESAELEIRNALDMRRRLGVGERMNVAYTLQSLAEVVRRQERLDEAEELLRESLAIRKSLRAENHLDVAMAQFALAEVLRERERPAEAVELHRAALTAREAALGNEHLDVARSLLALGNVLVQVGEFVNAERFLRRCVEASRRVAPVNDCQVASAQSALARCLAVQNRFEEAEPLVVESYLVLLAARGPNDPSTHEAIQYIIDLYDAWGKPELAAEYRAGITAP